MGLDINGYRAKNHEVFKHNFWENPEVTEIFYFRKHWDMLYNLDFIDVDKDYGEYIELTKENLEQMIYAATHNRDYFGGFDGVPALCEALDHYDADINEGWHYYLEFDY